MPHAKHTKTELSTARYIRFHGFRQQQADVDAETETENEAEAETEAEAEAGSRSRSRWKLFAAHKPEVMAHEMLRVNFRFD